MAYVDGYVIVVPKKNASIYRKMAETGKKVWMRHGALEYFECMGDDLHPKMGGMKVPTFLKMAGAKKGEDVWFSFVVFKSKSHRNSVNAKVMRDPAMSPEASKDKPMPFDMKKFAYGGFKAMVVGRK